MFKHFTRRLHAWQQQRVAIRKLRQMDDRMLSDLGTNRDAIEDFVRDCASR